jgi:hypothetical protein
LSTARSPISRGPATTGGTGRQDEVDARQLADFSSDLLSGRDIHDQEVGHRAAGALVLRLDGPQESDLSGPPLDAQGEPATHPHPELARRRSGEQGGPRPGEEGGEVDPRAGAA